MSHDPLQLKTLERVIDEPANKPSPADTRALQQVARQIALDPQAWSPELAGFRRELIELTDEARGFLKALASETRQQILMLFTGGIELTVNQVSERMSLAQSAASTHLATLRDGGVLIARREWKTVYYRVDSNRVSRALMDLQSALQACCPPDGGPPSGACS